MRIWMLAAGAAALAVTAPALSQQGQGRGGGKDKGGQVERGGGNKAAARQQKQEKQVRSRGGEQRQAKAERGSDRERGKAFAQGGRDDRRTAKAVRAEERGDRGRGRGDDVRIAKAGKAKDNRGAVRVRDLGDDDVVVIRRSFDRDLFPGRGRGLIAGCPPGLDKRDNGCMPPGQLKNVLGTPLARTAFANSMLPYNYRSWYRDDDDYFYRAGDGFIYRVDRDNGLIDGLLPLAMGGYGGYYALNDPWPDPYDWYNVPYQYRSTWYDRGDDCYRYDGWGAIYRVNCDTNTVNSIVSLLAGDLGVGSPLPMTYNVYNVPMQYRTSYYDTPDAWYRYNDGYIYRVDPTTRLITAVIDALV